MALYKYAYYYYYIEKKVHTVYPMLYKPTLKKAKIKCYKL